MELKRDQICQMFTFFIVINPVCLCFNFEDKLKASFCIPLMFHSERKYQKWKMSPVTVRRNCVVCEIQWFNGKFRRGSKACVGKIKGDDERLKEEKKEIERESL